MSSVVPIAPVGPVAAATMVFRENGVLHVTAIVKATFAFAHHAVMALAQPEPIFTREAHRMNNPTRSIVATSDLVPRMPAADVLLLGHAHAPGGSAAHMEVRLVVGRGESTVLDKTVHVVGDRRGDEIKLFRDMPLAYEKAYGGPGCRDNPLGTGVLAGDPLPNLVDPAARDRVVGFAPISRSWPSRSSLVPAEVRAGLDRPIAEIPPGFDHRFFHAAPLDQRVSHLLGDEWIVLEGMHPSIPHIHVQLPGAQARTRIVGGEADGRVFSLRADTLRIDADAERCVLVWRNSFPVRESDLGAFGLQAAVALLDAPITWPDPGDSLAPPPTQPLLHDVRPSIQQAAGGTMILSDEPVLAATFSGTMEVADDDIESVHFDRPVGLGQPPPQDVRQSPPQDVRQSPPQDVRQSPPQDVRQSPPRPDFSTTANLGPDGPPTAPLPAFWQRTAAPQPPPPPPPAAAPRARAAPDPKERTLDLSNHLGVLRRAVIPFAGDQASALGSTPGSDPSPAPRSSTPIPGSPWDPDRHAGLPLEEASTAEADALDLMGTLASPTRSPVAPPAAPPAALPVPPQTVSLSGEPPPWQPASPPEPPQPASPPAPPQPASPPAPPPVQAASPPEPQRSAPPAAPASPPVDPWGQALREAAEPAAPAPARQQAASPPAAQGPSVRSALYKRFKK